MAIISKAFANTLADELEEYCDIIDTYTIIEGLTQEEYDEAQKTVKKLIKHLRKGNIEKVIDLDAYERIYLRRGE